MEGNTMKKIAIIFALLFFLATVNMATAASVKEVSIKELCRSDETIIYGIFDKNDGSLIDTLEAKGFLGLIDEIKIYEQQNGVKLFWHYSTNKRTEQGYGTFEIYCS